MEREREHPTDLVLALADRLPRDQYRALCDALSAGWKIESATRRIHARYTDYDLAEQVPRVLMYLDIGALVGRIRALEGFLVEQGYQLAEEDPA